MEIGLCRFGLLRVGSCKPILFIFWLNLQHFADTACPFLRLRYFSLLSFNEGDRSWFCALSMLFLLLDSELVHFSILILAHTAITSGRLSITAILFFMWVALSLLLKPIGSSLQLQKSLDNSCTHFVIVRYLELCNPILLQIS